MRLLVPLSGARREIAQALVRHAKRAEIGEQMAWRGFTPRRGLAGGRFSRTITPEGGRLV